MLVLVVEDDTDLRAALGDALEGEGIEVALARDGHDALERLRSGLRPAVILLDILMPGVDGIEFRRRQIGEGFAEIPVVGMTGDRRQMSALAALDLAAVLSKPLGVAELVRVLREVGTPDEGGA